jgi:hypothetical protein
MSSSQFDDDSKKGAWTPEEDEQLKELVALYGPKGWSVIAKDVPGRSGKSCRLRCVPVQPASSIPDESTCSISLAFNRVQSTYCAYTVRDACMQRWVSNSCFLCRWQVVQPAGPQCQPRALHALGGRRHHPRLGGVWITL